MNHKHKTKQTIDTSEIAHNGATKVERYGWRIVDEPGEFRWVDKNDLHVDDSYQRNASVEKIKTIRREWSWVGCGAIVVAQRGDGSLFVMDGQHRVLASKSLDHVKALPCIVFTKCSIVDEARGFLRVNTHRKHLTTAERHAAMIVEGDLVAIEAERLAKVANRSISGWSGPNTIGCVGILHKLVRTKREPLRRVWDLLVEVCDGHVFNERLLQALVEIESRLPEDQSLSDRRWRQRVISIGHTDLLEAANRAAAYYATGGNKVWAEGVLREINKGLRTHKLTPKGMGLE